MATMQVEVVSPETVLFSGEATQVITRTLGGGEIAFLPGHAPFLGALTENHTRITLTDGTVLDVAVHGGFVQVSGTQGQHPQRRGRAGRSDRSQSCDGGQGTCRGAAAPRARRRSGGRAQPGPRPAERHRRPGRRRLPLISGRPATLDAGSSPACATRSVVRCDTNPCGLRRSLRHDHFVPVHLSAGHRRVQRHRRGDGASCWPRRASHQVIVARRARPA